MAPLLEERPSSAWERLGMGQVPTKLSLSLRTVQHLRSAVPMCVDCRAVWPPASPVVAQLYLRQQPPVKDSNAHNRVLTVTSGTGSQFAAAVTAVRKSPASRVLLMASPITIAAIWMQRPACEVSTCTSCPASTSSVGHPAVQDHLRPLLAQPLGLPPCHLPCTTAPYHRQYMWGAQPASTVTSVAAHHLL